MKCPNCDHNILEKGAKFCSECGQKLPVQPTRTQDAGDQPKSLVADSGTIETSGSPEGAPSADSEEPNKFPKRPNDGTLSNLKKKKKKKRKNKKKKDGTLSSEQDQSLSESSHASLVAKGGKAMKDGGESSDSESSDNAMDETPDSLQDGPSSIEAQTNSSATTPAAPSEIAVNTAATVETQSSVKAPDNPEPESNAPQSTPDQTLKKTPAKTSTHQPIAGDGKTTTPQSGPGKGTKPTNPKDQKNDKNSLKNKKDADATKHPALDQNANEEPKAKPTGQTKEKGKNQAQIQKQAPVAEQKMIFGPQTPSTAASKGSSVDPEGTQEPMVVQQSGHEADSTAERNSDVGDKSKDNEESSTLKGPPPKRVTRSKTIAARERLTIYFHAVLSKDFKFDLNKDRIFIRAGSHIGNWEENVVELFVTRDLGEHGFLVEGNLQASKSDAQAESIPYKYVIYHEEKGKYEFEFIYKLDAQHITNRCLFVKPHLLSAEGDWHQYDDIICAEQSKNMFKRLKEKVWGEQKKNLIQGREIAGNVMLETIFELLQSWTDVNVTSFVNQLNQFFHVYGEPFVYEERGKKWHSLDYGQDDVRKMLKEFMLTKVTPQLLKDGEGQMLYRIFRTIRRT